MRKFLFFIYLASLFASCKAADILFFCDEKYAQVQPKENSVFQIVKQTAKESGFKVAIENVKVEQLEPDLSTNIEATKAKFILLSPYLARRASQYANSYQSKYFCALDANSKTALQNTIYLVKNREDYFKELASEVYDLQRLGHKVGASFLLSDARRQNEKNIFDSTLKFLNNGNFDLEEYNLQRSDNNRAARDIYIRMNSQNIEYLILFCGSLTVDVIEEFPQNCQIKLITEGFYPSDEIFKEFICYSINYDYQKAFTTLIATFKKISQGTPLLEEELNIDLSVRPFQIGEKLPAFEFEESSSLGDNESDTSSDDNIDNNIEESGDF